MIDGPECFEVKSQTARLAHTCHECSGLIKPGEKYIVTSGIWDGRPERFKMCPHCNELFNHFASNSDGEGVYYGNLYEWVFESKDVDIISGFIANKESRGAEVRPWMRERLNDLKEKV